LLILLQVIDSRFFSLLGFAVFLLYSTATLAQTERMVLDTLPQTQADTSVTKNKVKVKNSDNFIAEIKDDIDIQYFRGNVRMIHDSIYMFADSAIIEGNQMTAIGEVVIIQEDTINMFADSLVYNADSKLAKLYNNVVLDADDKQLFTDYLIYDLAAKQGSFVDTAILKRNTMTLSSLKGNYNVQSKTAFFYDQVVIIDEDFELTCDSLDYDTDIDRAYFLSQTYINQGTKRIYCEDGYYDMEDKRAFFTANAKVVDGRKEANADNILISEIDSTYTLTGSAEVIDSTSRATGNEIIFDDKTGDILILGQGEYENENTRIVGPNIQFNEDTENMYCVGRTVVHNENGVLTADTIEYIKQIDLGTAVGEVVWQDTSEDRTLLTETLMYKDSSEYVKASKGELKPLLMQEVDGDTLYVCADSTFTLFGNPICWSDTTQFKGDTIMIVLANDEVSEIIAKKNAFITTKQIGNYFDQIKGRYIHSYMDSNELRLMHIKGNAEALHLIKDDEDAYVGPNRTQCSHMSFFFQQNELDSIKFYTQPESKMTPMEKAADKDLKLDGFYWETNLRPESHENLRSAITEASRYPVRSEEETDSFEEDVLKVMENTGEPAMDKGLPKSNPKGSGKN